MIPTVDQLEVKDKRVFVRVDFNVPLDAGGNITDPTRIEAAMPTLRYLKEQGARLVLASHLGRPKGKVDRKYSLLPVAEYLSANFNDEVLFPENCVGSGIMKLSQELRPGGVLLLENLRFYEGEESNDADFSEKLAALADVYVNDAFGALHREHASVAGMVKHFDQRGIGFLVQKEFEVLSALASEPQHPFWAVIGGAKVADKIGLIERLVDSVDGLVLGGGLAYTFLKAQGHEIGKSRFEEDKLRVAERILKRAESKDVPVLLPVDHRVAASVTLDVAGQGLDATDIPSEMFALDIGPKTEQTFVKALAAAKTIFWNGPMGFFENPAFAGGTQVVAKAVVQATQDHQATSVIGGGDSVAALNELQLADQVTHISTGGGASLAYLEGQELPGLKALEVPA